MSPQAKGRVGVAATVTDHIANGVAEIRDGLVAAMRDAGWSVSPGQDPIGLDGAAVVMTGRAQVNDVSRDLIERGMVPQHDLSPGAIAALLRSRHQFVLMPGERGPVTRVELRWGEPKRPAKVVRHLTPAIVDLRAVSLPSWLWWAYWVVRPLRMILDRLTRRRTRTTAPFLGTPTDLVRPLLDLVSPEPDETVADLGCGDGRVLIETAHLYGCRGLGVESDPRLVSIAEQAVLDAGLEERVSIVEGDLAGIDVDHCRIIFMFLPTGQVAKLLVDLLHRIGPGKVVMAHEQAPADWPVAPDATHLIMEDAGVTVAYLWRT